jgi:cell division septation protein DedD
MENKPKGTKTITNLLSKTVGLIFFSFLAISLGVVFGLLFDGWVKDQPGTQVGTENTNLQSVDLPSEKQPAITEEENSTKTTKNLSSGSDSTTKPVENLTVKPLTTVKFKVRVGPYSNHDQALAASTQLQSLGYPVYVGNAPPFAVQVGAFATQNNADRLKSELTGKGYKVFVEKSQ